MPSPTPSSSKRQAQAPPAASPRPHKHPRKSDSPSVHTPEGGDGGDGGDDVDGDDHYPEDDAEELVGVTPDMDGEARAKVARKEARTIRNRESAQRSRNQRKHHLAWLETRVVELEAENRALRGNSAVPTAPTAPGTPAPPTAPSQAKAPLRGLSAQPHPTTPAPAHREPSPAQSVMSLASDLGLPAELVGAGAGVSLASVAPPPADLALQVDCGVGGRVEEEDVKPVLLDGGMAVGTGPQSAVSGVGVGLEAENAVLRERVALLENLVKQVVAVSDLGGLVPPVLSNPSPALAPAPAHLHGAIGDDVHPDWTAFLSLGHTLSHPHITQQGGLESTLSPPLFSAFDLPGAAQAEGEGFGRQPESSLGAGAETLGVALLSHPLPQLNAQSHLTSQHPTQPQTHSQTSTQSQTQPQAQSTPIPTTQPSNPVACHSAVVVTPSAVCLFVHLVQRGRRGAALQRAKGSSLMAQLVGRGVGAGEGAGDGVLGLGLGLGLETSTGTAMDLDAELLSWDSAMNRLIEDVEGQAEMAGLGAGVRVKQEMEEREWWAREGVMA